MTFYDGTGVYYFLAQSLDGYIADSSGGLDWLFHPTGGGTIDDADSDPHLYRRFFSEVGAMVIGSGTYESILDEGRHDEWPYGSMPCWVFSSREVRRWPGADIRIVRGDVAPVHEQMRAMAGRRLIWIVGGGNLASQFAAEGLLGALDHAGEPAKQRRYRRRMLVEHALLPDRLSPDQPARHRPAMRYRHHRRVGVQVVRQRDHSSGHDQSARSPPGRLIDVERGAEHRPAVAVEQVPGRCDVVGRVTGRHRAEVEDPGHRAVTHQQVGGQQVGVQPDGRAVPVRCRERVVPEVAHPIHVEQSLALCQCRTELFVPSEQRAPAAEAFRSRGGSTGHVDGP